MKKLNLIYRNHVEQIDSKKDTPNYIVELGSKMRKDGDDLLGIGTEDMMYVWEGHLKREDVPLLHEMCATARMLF